MRGHAADAMMPTTCKGETAVKTRIKHMAILSPDALHLSRFYVGVFGMDPEWVLLDITDE